jgi:hypothetical protein
MERQENEAQGGPADAAAGTGHNLAPTTMSGGEALARMLKLGEAGPCFGMGGFQLLPFYDAARRSGLIHHLINDERTGGFAADAWARVAGRPGLCDATLGPGATNLVTPLVEALNAGVPLIALTGNSNRAHSWKNMTQEARQTEILRPAVKELIRIEHIHRIPELVRRAFAVATSGRPGPVVLDVPEDVCHDVHDFPHQDFWIDPATTSIPARPSRPDPAAVEAAALLIAGARRPMLLVGGGIHLSGAYDALQSLAEAWTIPVAHTLSGKGAIACTHPLSAGLFGRYSRIANDLIAASDCLIVVGCKLGEIATKRYALMPPGVPLIHLDIEAEEIGRTTPATVGLVGDPRNWLRLICSPIVLGSVKSGAGSPTSSATAIPATPSALTSSTPNSHRLCRCLGSIPISLSPSSDGQVSNLPPWGSSPLDVSRGDHRTSRSAWYNIAGTMAIPSAFATFRLMANSIFGFTSAGTSAGFPPLSILSTRRAA